MTKEGLIGAVFGAAIAAVGACSSDVFHSTDWPSACDSKPISCTVAASSSVVSVGSGGGGGGGSGGLGGAGGLAGAGGQGGAAGTSSSTASGMCTLCYQVLATNIMPTNWCAGSPDLYAAVVNCRCPACGMISCAGACTMSQPPTAECTTCTNTSCPTQIAACENDTGM